MVDLGRTIGAIPDYMPGCNGRTERPPQLQLENTVEVLAPDSFGTPWALRMPVFHQLPYVRSCSAVCMLRNLPRGNAVVLPQCT